MSLGAVLFLAFIVAQRLGELMLARRNTARLMARSAREVGAGLYTVMVALHGAWLPALVGFGHDRPLHPFWLVFFALLQLLRLWIRATLRPRRTTRIIVIDAPFVAHGPFRFTRHPNYALEVAEIIAAPCARLTGAALVFTALNAALLWHRIRIEDAALHPRRTRGHTSKSFREPFASVAFDAPRARHRR